ncbi:MAG: MFS transporter, partial [Nocardioides sp.]
MPGTSAGSYAHILGLPAVLRTFAFTLLGRLTYGVLPLALLFTIQEATGSFAIAASAMGLNGLASLSMPIKSRAIDRYGQRFVLPVISLSLSVALAGAALLASSGLQHSGVWLATALLIGLASPPLGPSMRAQWRLLVPREQLTAAYSLDAVAEESLYLIGPVIAAGLLAVAPPYAGLLVCAGLVVFGGLGLATSPVADRRPDATKPRVGLGPLRHAHFLALLAVMAVVGLISATVFTATAARALAAGQPSLAG